MRKNTPKRSCSILPKWKKGVKTAAHMYHPSHREYPPPPPPRGSRQLFYDLQRNYQGANMFISTLFNKTMFFFRTTHKIRSIARPQRRCMECPLWVQSLTYNLHLAFSLYTKLQRHQMTAMSSRITAKQVVKTDNKEKSEACLNVPLCGESTGHRWIPLTKGR